MLTGVFLKILFIYFFREGKGGRKRGRETSMWGCLLCAPTGDLARNPGMCPDWEFNQWLFGSQAGAQSTQPHQPGTNVYSEGHQTDEYLKEPDNII